MDITKQYQDQQEAKRLQGKITSFIEGFQVGTLLNKSGIRKLRGVSPLVLFFTIFKLPFEGNNSFKTVLLFSFSDYQFELAGKSVCLVKYIVSHLRSSWFTGKLFLSLSYPVVDTGQTVCYNSTIEISCPRTSEDFAGQDAQHNGYKPSYTDNSDGTITDNVTGLMWQQSADSNGDGDIDTHDKFTYQQAVAGTSTLSLGGYNDW